MPKISIFGNLTNIQILLHTLLRGKRVGTDGSGNVYYRAAPRKGYTRERRWVIYKGATEASAVPPEWHGWLHHQTDAVPAETNPRRRPWQKPHQPNLTGTAQAHKPPPLKGGARAAATGDYASWKPGQETE